MRFPASAHPLSQEPLASAEQLPSADEVSGVLREILSDPDFATFEPPPWRRLLGWVWDTLNDAWDWLQRLMAEDGSGAAEIVVVLVALAALVVMARLAAAHAPKFLASRVEGEPAAEPQVPLTALEWFSTASTRAGRGELRPAATALYQGFLLSLDQRGVLSYHKSKTPGDYAREVARGRAAGRPATAFLDSFQDFSFGLDEPTPARYAVLATIAREAGCPTDTAEAGARAEPETEPEAR